VKDETNNQITTKFDYRFVLSKDSEPEPRERASDFRKVFYMIFSNSLLRLKANMHLFHYLIQYPNLGVERLMSRNCAQLTVSNGVDRVQTPKTDELRNQANENDASRMLKALVRLRLPAYNDSHVFNIFSTNVGVNEGVNMSDPVSFLGKGGFGEVKMASFINK
jgi:hypothetical protein